MKYIFLIKFKLKNTSELYTQDIFLRVKWFFASPMEVSENYESSLIKMSEKTIKVPREVSEETSVALSLRTLS